ncbi:ankyrin repeat domain-containing protein 7-like [Gigantopelta aegis]|uniref:ankyrin repeat domain-containing protein 7-like n=1 Tax=Gigantopelta aegis TaxID=1735272 RepID=UPI001B88A09B|nr:ankyrin repeat domain-containing protein 7-like [Gigantopelta aegis]
MEAREKLKEILKKGNVKHLDKLLKDLPPRSILSRVNEELDSDGTTPLIHCVKCAGVSFADSGTGFIDCCIYLIKHGAKVGTKDTHGKTPLFYAASNKNDRLGQTLLAAGADPFVKNQNGVSILGIAIQTGAIGTAKKIIEEFDTVLNEVDGTGCPPLILSLQLGNDDLCRFLLDKGADVNIQEERSHRTALHYALYMKKHEIFEKILSRNPNFELTDYKNTTIIHRASTIHDVQYLKSIFDSKMPPSSILLNLSDCDGANAVMLACQNGNFEHLKLLAEHGVNMKSFIARRDKRHITIQCANTTQTLFTRRQTQVQIQFSAKCDMIV